MTPPPAASACRICGHHEGNRPHLAREMMFGSGAPFDYFECASCGCVQIAELPRSVAGHYPPGYYSLRPFREPAWRGFLKERRVAHLMGRRSRLGALLAARVGAPAFLSWLRRLDLKPDDPILDVGCGGGQLLYELGLAGFHDLTGIDPYAPPDAVYPRGVRVLRQDLAAVRARYRLVVWNHSFEHVGDPHEAIRETRRVLAEGGTVVIRTPVAGTHAWRTYGVNWVQLDAPRHLHVQSERSLRAIARAAGLEVVETLWDSTAFQFWGSEQYARGISLLDPRSYARSPRRADFTRKRIREFEAEATRLNARGDGDQATFILRPAAEAPSSR